MSAEESRNRETLRSWLANQPEQISRSVAESIACDYAALTRVDRPTKGKQAMSTDLAALAEAYSAVVEKARRFVDAADTEDDCGGPCVECTASRLRARDALRAALDALEDQQ